MPSLELKTNVQISKPKEFLLEFSKLSAELLGKPEAYISTSYSYNEYLTFAGSFEPAFLLTINSLDNIDHDRNEKYSAALFKFFEEKLGVPGNRAYITFTDPGRSYIGFKGTTFGSIFGRK